MQGAYLMQCAKMALKQRSFKTLCWAILIAGLMLSCVHMTEQRLHLGLRHYGRTLLGSDLMLTSDQGMPKSWQQQADVLGLSHTQSYQWHTMAEGHGTFQLVNIVAVPPSLMSTYFLADHNTRVLQKDEIYITPALAQKLNLDVSSVLTFNGHTFRVAGFREPQPFRMSQVRALLAPTVWISMADVTQLNLFRLGAQIDHVLFVSGPQNNRQSYIKKITPTLRPGQKIRNTATLQSLGKRFKQVHQVLAWFAWMGMVFAVLVVAMATQRYLTQQRSTIMLLASFGIPPDRILRFFVVLCGLAICTTLCMALGITLLLHVLLHFGLPAWAQTLWPMLGGAAGAGIALSWGTAMGLSVLCPIGYRQHLEIVHSDHQSRLRWLDGLPPAMVLLSYGITHMGPLMTIAWILFLIVASCAFLGLSHGLKRTIQTLAMRASCFIRLALHMTLHDWMHHQRQLLVVGIIATLVGCWVLIVHALTSNWLQRLPAQTPNVFIMQVMPKQQQAIVQWFEQHDLPSPHLFPAIRGRLLSKNGMPIRDAVPANAQQHNALNRALTFSEGHAIPPSNSILAGTWQPNPPTPEVSLEQTFAQQLGLKIGDQLGITVQAKTLYAKVTSIRTLNWLDFSPNFYCFFSPNTFSGMAHTLFGSFYLPRDHRQARLQAFYRAFPNVVVLDLSTLFVQIHTFSKTVGWVLSGLLWLITVLGTMIFGIGLLDHNVLQHQDRCIVQHWGANRRQYDCCFVLNHVCVFGLTLLFTWVLLYWTTSSLIHHAFDVDQTWPMTALNRLFGGLWLCLVGATLYLKRPKTSS